MIRYIHLEDSMPRRELRHAIGTIADRGEQLRHVGSAIEGARARSFNMSARQLRHLATRVRAAAAHALELAAGAIEMAGRLDVIAAIHESEQQPAFAREEQRAIPNRKAPKRKGRKP